MTTWQRRVAWVMVCGVVTAGIAVGAGRLMAQTPMGVNPGVFGGIFFRPLTVFSRGGRVTAVAGVASDTKTYYMGSAGGVFKTTDAGVTWTPITDGQIGVGSIGAIEVAAADANVVYVGTGT